MSNGKYYFFNINKICDYVNYSDKNTSKETEIMDSYEDGKMVAKTIRELTSPGNSQIDNIKYDLIKTFILQIISYEDGMEVVERFPLGLQIAFNTMLEEGLLIEKNVE